MIWVNCVFISHSSTREHVQSRAPGIEDKGHHVFCAVVGARPDLRTTRQGEPAEVGVSARARGGALREINSELNRI